VLFFFRVPSFPSQDSPNAGLTDSVHLRQICGHEPISGVMLPNLGDCFPVKFFVRSHLNFPTITLMMTRIINGSKRQQKQRVNLAMNSLSLFFPAFIALPFLPILLFLKSLPPGFFRHQNTRNYCIGHCILFPFSPIMWIKKATVFHIPSNLPSFCYNK
jgi:hypothetical protein